MVCTNKVLPPVQNLGVAHNGDPLVPQSSPVPLSTEELRTFAELEEAIAKGERSFVDMGLALATIRDAQLHREYHKSFKAYCRGRWALSRQRAYQLIGAAETATYLSSIVDTVTPTNESQVRPLVGKPLDEVVKVWKLANASGAPVTGASVKKAMKALLGDVPKPQNPIADLLENILRTCNRLAEQFYSTDFSDIDPRDKSRLASAISEVVGLATEAGCWSNQAEDVTGDNSSSITIPLWGPVSMSVSAPEGIELEVRRIPMSNQSQK